jgi:hypothetical protein
VVEPERERERGGGYTERVATPNRLLTQVHSAGVNGEDVVTPLPLLAREHSVRHGGHAGLCACFSISAVVEERLME